MSEHWASFGEPHNVQSAASIGDAPASTTSWSGDEIIITWSWLRSQNRVCLYKVTDFKLGQSLLIVYLYLYRCCLRVCVCSWNLYNLYNSYSLYIAWNELAPPSQQGRDQRWLDPLLTWAQRRPVRIQQCGNSNSNSGSNSGSSSGSRDNGDNHDDNHNDNNGDHNHNHKNRSIRLRLLPPPRS